ncbi:lipase family protein [Actinomycetes bacterium M1A6_2h]
MKIRVQVTVAAAVAVMAMGSGVAAADPIGDLVTPPRDAASYEPTPLGDPFFDAPAGFENAAPGTIFTTRPVAVPKLSQPVTATQYLFRSTDSKDRPIVAATTILVPTAPWGAGARPVVSFNPATDSLGNACAPSYTLPRGTNAEVDSVNNFLDRNYAVVVTDYQGPRQAYSAGRVEGHTVLDGLRAAVNSEATGLTPSSPIGITGYSGGAIASGWAAQLAPSYAPELNIAGVSFGGPPTDYSILRQSLNGHIGAGLYMAATFGLAREYPELNAFVNDNGRRLSLIYRDQCSDFLSYSGIFMIDQAALQNDPNAFFDPVVQKVVNENRMGAFAPTAPVYIYQGIQDFLIPKEGAENLQKDWCAKGASVHLEEIPGEHTIAEDTGSPGAFDWLAQRLGGAPAPADCSLTVR